MAIRYTMHIVNKGEIMPYKGKGHGWPDLSFKDLNSIRKYACTLLPRDSFSRVIMIYVDGTDSGFMVRKEGIFYYIPAHPPYDNQISYKIDPATGRTITNSKKKLDWSAYRKISECWVNGWTSWASVAHLLR